jgi:hypothetical protein
MVRSAGPLASAITATTHSATRASGFQKLDATFAETFAIGDLGENRDATEPQVFNPPPGPWR